MTTNNSQNNLETLERLCELVEKSGADIAPGYNEYVVLAFAIANSCGEAGRSGFHRLCVLSYKYNATGADRLYTEAVKKGRGGNSLGTAFHLADVAGVDLGEMRNYRARFPEMGTPPSVFHGGVRAGARTYYTPSDTIRGVEGGNGGNMPQNGQIMGAFTGNAAAFRGNFRKTPGEVSPDLSQQTDEAFLEKLPFEREEENLPDAYPECQWPPFLQRILDCGDRAAQRDMIFCSTVAALGATVSGFAYTYYSQKPQYPCLQVFITAASGSGKGAISWVRQLVMPFHKEKLAHYQKAKDAYQVELRTWANEGRKRDESLKPKAPKLELFFIAGNNSGTGILENLMDNNGYGCIMEAEAEVLSKAIESDYGQWSHTLRQAFDHEFVSYNRRKDSEYREIDAVYLTVVVCGTPGQLLQLIPSSENGLFSREVFYFMPPINEFMDMFHLGGRKNYPALFRSWGERWKKVIDAIRKSVHSIELTLTEEQIDLVLNHFSQLFNHTKLLDNSDMKSFVVRLNINQLRIMTVVALIRSLNSLLMMEDEDALNEKLQNISRTLLGCEGIAPSPEISAENIADGVVSDFVLSINDEDFQSVFSLAEPMYRHGEHAQRLMPCVKVQGRKISDNEEFLASLPLAFTRQGYLKKGRELNFSDKKSEYCIEALIKKGVLERTERGKFRILGRKAGKKAAKSAENAQNSEDTPSEDTL